MSFNRDDYGQLVPKAKPDPRDAEIARLLAETQALRAELEALKPKPTIEVHYTHVSRLLSGAYGFHNIDSDPNKYSNLKLTFRDGVLVAAEVLK